MNHTVVLAYDGDVAGKQAADNALLTMLDVEDDRKDYLRSYVIDGKSFSESIKYLSNQELSAEYRFWSQKIGVGEWLPDLFKEHAEQCMALISQRASLVNQRQRNNAFDEFNAEHTITEVLSSFGYNGVPGRSVRCPSHDDSSPSLSISRDDGRAYCFNQSCPLWHDGYGVDAFELNRILGG